MYELFSYSFTFVDMNIYIYMCIYIYIQLHTHIYIYIYSYCLQTTYCLTITYLGMTIDYQSHQRSGHDYWLRWIHTYGVTKILRCWYMYWTWHVITKIYVIYKQICNFVMNCFKLDAGEWLRSSYNKFCIFGINSLY